MHEIVLQRCLGLGSFNDGDIEVVLRPLGFNI